MSNPLLRTDAPLPAFSEIKPEHLEPAIKELCQRNQKAITKLLQTVDEPTWENLMYPMAVLDNELDKAWSPASHLNSVMNSEAMRKAYDACLPILSDYSTWIGQNKALFDAISRLYERADELQLDKAQRKILADEIRDFKLAGVALPSDKKQRYGEIKRRLSELSSKFEQNLLDATQAWTKHITDDDQLAGLPESALAMARQAAKEKDRDGYLITLEFPSYYAVMTHADDRCLREELYRAYVTRASDVGPNAGEFDNGPIMEEILALRYELAQLLGYANYAEVSLAPKMAPDSDHVVSFMEQLVNESKAQAEVELQQLRNYARDHYQLDELQAWDLMYLSEKLREHTHSISQEQLRPYFPEDKVIEGLFTISGQLFDVTFKEVEQFDRYHKAVRFFELQRDGATIGHFYLDLYARSNKRGGAWMADYCGRLKFSDARVQTPVAFLTCNFNGPTEGKPALFTHDEVTTLFHEFGHGLHHLLTKVDYPEAAGISNVPWDAVELPSQFMENFCYEREGLDHIAGHYQSGEPLPSDLLEKLQAARNFQSAMQMLRQLEFALFDFILHRNYDPARGARVQETLNKIRSQVAVFSPPEFNRFQHSFSHIFAGGYAAGYYSYKWAEVLSADAYSRFEEEGVLNTETGRDFRTCILEKGGTEEPMELFKAFRGREPSIEPLLRHSGIIRPEPELMSR